MVFSPDLIKKVTHFKFFFHLVLVSAVILGVPTSVYSQEGGYVGKLSVSKGDQENFFISSVKETLYLQIYRLGLQKVKVLELDTIKGGIQPVPDSAYAKGCGWQQTATITIPDSWLPGVYEADFPTSYGIGRSIFVVKERKLGTYSKAVVCLTVNTYEAYNNWGGKGLYDFNSTDKKRAYKVSFNRPFANDSTFDYYHWTNKFVRWLDKEGMPVEYCTNLDLDNNPRFLDHYDVYVSVGHDEYWSKPERNSFEHFVARGGRMMILTGNTCWWQVRVEDSSQTLVCYKDDHLDPLYPKQDSIVTCIWRRAPVSDTENSLTGVSFEQGGYVNSGATLSHSQGYGGFTVYHSWHWIYNNTGVNEGDIMGYNSAVVGYETDGTPFNWISGLPVVTGKGKTPLNFSILGLSPALAPDELYPGHATMGYYTNPQSGAVFNVATTNWVDGLIAHPDSTIIRITRNVLNRFMKREALPPEIYLYSPVIVTQDSINQELVPVGSRSIPLTFDRADTFIVHARDPIGRELHYIWLIGQNIISQDSFVVLTPDEKKYYSDGTGIRVLVTNYQDTVSLGWTLLNTKITFTSLPPDSTFSPHSEFEYKPEAVSLECENIHYQIISAPSWLKMDSSNTIVGIIKALPGTYTISLSASDTLSDQVVQTFQIHVENAILPLDSLPGVGWNIRAYPDPFTSITQITYDLIADADVVVDITNILGVHIHSFTWDQPQIKGSHVLFWEGRDDRGMSVPRGVYFFRFLIQGPSDQNPIMTLTLIKQ